jgi:DNA (cytosine-5)-methyltransferase 1
MHFSSVELFAGAGGLAQGLALSGFHPRLVAEWNRDACQTLRENHDLGHALVKDWNVVEGDVAGLSFDGFAGVDLISGGPPCQPFSIGGKHKAYDDHRDMFPQAIRAVREARPRAFIFENVKGITRQTFRNYFEYIRLQLQYPEVVRQGEESWNEHLAHLEQHHFSKHKGDTGLTYSLATEVLQAADYGVPQKRERVFFVGFRDDLEVDWHFPLPTHSREELLYQQYVTGDYWKRHNLPLPESVPVLPLKVQRLAHQGAMFDAPSVLPWRTVRDAIHDLPDPVASPDNGFPNHVYIPGARSYPGHTGSPLDEPSKALKAGDHGVPGGENMIRFADGSVRYFTVRESARIQTFDDSYYFAGAWGETMRQLGNAVPVQLARVVASSVALALENTREAAA